MWLRGQALPCVGKVCLRITTMLYSCNIAAKLLQVME